MPGPLAASSSLFAGAEKVRSWIAGLSSANLGGEQSAGDIHSRGAGNRVCRESRRELAERKEAEEACELCGVLSVKIRAISPVTGTCWHRVVAPRIVE